MSNTTTAVPSIVGGRDVESVRLGTGAYAGKVGPSLVDLSMPAKVRLRDHFRRNLKISTSILPGRP